MMVAFTSKKEQAWKLPVCGLRAVNPMLPQLENGTVPPDGNNEQYNGMIALSTQNPHMPRECCLKHTPLFQ